jgi:hypothetical protein
MVIVDSFFLPISGCGLIIPEHAESLFVPAAGPVVMALGELGVGIGSYELV